jgi:hypothetical protein
MITDINNLKPVEYDNTDITPILTGDVNTPSSTDDFGPTQMNYNTPVEPDYIGPASPVRMTLTGVEPSLDPTAEFEPTAKDSTDNAASEPSTSEPSAAPDQGALNSAFRKYMGSSFDPNSSMDRGKMETVKKALADFQTQNNKQFDINDSEDLTKMRSIMNAAYQSPEYKQAAGQRATQPSTRQQTPAQKAATAPVSQKGGPTYYVRTGFNRYVPAVEADIKSNQQLFMRNPNRAAATVYPYVKVDSRPIRRATPAR